VLEGRGRCVSGYSVDVVACMCMCVCVCVYVRACVRANGNSLWDKLRQVGTHIVVMCNFSRA
jgi:hypothetical protein